MIVTQIQKLIYDDYCLFLVKVVSTRCGIPAMLKSIFQSLLLLGKRLYIVFLSWFKLLKIIIKCIPFSEHQPTTWFSLFFDLHILVCTFPVGIWFCIKKINDERVFSKSIILMAKLLWYVNSLQIIIKLFYSSCTLCLVCCLLCWSNGSTHLDADASCMCAECHCIFIVVRALSERRRKSSSRSVWQKWQPLWWGNIIAI